MKKEFLIKNNKGAISSLTIALIYVIFIGVTLISDFEIAEGYGVLEYLFLVLAAGVIFLDVVDILRMRKDELKILFGEDTVTVNSYWFNKKEYNYSLIENVNLTEKDIQFTYEGKKRSIGFLSKSDLIRAMKLLKDNCEQ